MKPLTPDPRYNPEDARIIRSKTRRLVGHWGFTSTDLPDLDQDLAIHVVVRQDRFDPSRGTRGAFVSTLTARRLIQLIEHRRALCRSGTRPHVAVQDTPAELLICKREDVARLNLQLDVQAALASMPAGLRHIATALGQADLAEVARDLRLSRGRLQSLRDDIRLHLLECGINAEHFGQCRKQIR